MQIKNQILNKLLKIIFNLFHCFQLKIKELVKIIINLFFLMRTIQTLKEDNHYKITMINLIVKNINKKKDYFKYIIMKIIQFHLRKQKK